MDKALFLIYGQIPEHICACGGMGLHYGKLLVCELAGLVEYLVVNGYLSDIVER